MFRLGFRLAVTGGREAVGRLALIAGGVALGVMLLLSTLGALNGIASQDARSAWMVPAADNSPADQSTVDTADLPAAGVAAVWWMLRSDYFEGTEIGRVDVAATGPDTPVPPGIQALPGPGEFYASPALSELIADAPGDQLGDRFGDTQVGVIGDEALPSPDSLIAVVGNDVDALAEGRQADDDPADRERAYLVERINRTVPDDCSRGCLQTAGTGGSGMTLILTVVVAALLFPVLVFIGGATRLSATRREQRFAAMRLIGATPRQIARIAVVESVVAAIIGVAAGFALFFPLRPAIAAVPFTGDPFFTSDLALAAGEVITMAIGIPLAAAVAARLALRRVNKSPLGVSRRVTPEPPSFLRLIPLVVGLGWFVVLAYGTDIGDNDDPRVQALAYLTGALVVMTGLLTAGPWFTMITARLVTRHAARPAPLLASRRLADNPTVAFRAISGLVLAVFVGTCATGVITTITAHNRGVAGDTARATGTLVAVFASPVDDNNVTIPDSVLGELSAIDGVTGLTDIHLDRTTLPPPDTNMSPASEPPSPYVVSCSDLAESTQLGRCPDGATTVRIRPVFGTGVITTDTPMEDTTWPDARLTDTEVDELPIGTIVISTDESTSAVERARTVLARSDLTTQTPLTLSEFNDRNTRTLSNLQRLANVVILASIVIAGSSLTVNVVAGLADRQRPFGLLRLTGTRLRTLARVVLLEGAAPLLLGAATAVMTGLIMASLFLRAQADYALMPPGASYYVFTIAGLLTALALILSTLPLLERITRPENARTE